MLLEAVARVFLKHYASIGIPVYRKEIQGSRELSADDIQRVLKRYPRLRVIEIDTNQYYLSSKGELFTLSLRIFRPWRLRFLPYTHARIITTRGSIIVVGYVFVWIACLVLALVIASFSWYGPIVRLGLLSFAVPGLAIAVYQYHTLTRFARDVVRLQ